MDRLVLRERQCHLVRFRDRCRATGARSYEPDTTLTQHSEYVVNVQLGYDSLDAKHSASLAYNVFGERIFFAGRNGAADAFEQPFQSLDLVYSYYPTDRLQITAKVKNLLDEDLQLKRGDVTVLEQEIGLLGTLEVSWQL